MKTSNKLLLILAVALLVIPLVGMIIHAKNSRIDGHLYKSTLKDEGENPNATDRYLVSRKVDSFTKIVIDGDKNLYTHVSIIKSDQALVKFGKGNADSFTTSVDATGTLHIQFKSDNRFHSSSIYVFVPSVESIHLNQLQVYNFETNFDSIAIAVSQINNTLYFGENKSLKTLHLTVKDSPLSIGELNQANSFLGGLEKFNLQVLNGSVSLPSSQYKSIHVDLQRGSLNFIQEREGDQFKTATVQNFNVTSTGVAQLSLSLPAVEISQLSGSLSDSTTIDLPYYRIKGLYGR